VRTRRFQIAVAGVLVLVMTAACTSGSTPEPIRTGTPTPYVVEFTDVASEVGLDFQQGAFRWEVSPDPAAMLGAGLCWLDYDGDGWLDLYAVNSYARAEAARWQDEGGLPRSALFHNVQGTFVDVSAGSGADLALRGNGCVAADFDLDGHTDLYVTTAEAGALLWNEGDGTFTEGAKAAGVESFGWHQAAAVGDVNGDGLPDIVIGNSAEVRPGRARASGQDFLWLNDKARPGHFIDATATHLPKVEDDTQGIALADLDADGDLDMVVANETPPGRLLLNNGKGRFKDASARLQLVTPLETREAHVFDATGDGKPDIVLFNLTSNNHQWDKDPQARLLVNDGSGRFRDETAARLPANTFSSWGGLPMDFDRDGDMDLIVGAIEVPGFKPLQVRAYANDGKGRFTDVTATVIPAQTAGRTWSMAKGDLDGDGREDLFIGAWGTQARLLLSRAPGATGQTGGQP
jgi:hypothetical protein